MKRGLGVGIAAVAFGSVGGCTTILGVEPFSAAFDAGEDSNDAPSCNDISSDPHNCGRCGHDCLGGACDGGTCQPVVILAEGEYSAPFAIALDSDYVYATGTFSGQCGESGGGGSVEQIPKDGGAPTALAHLLRNTWGIAVDPTSVYAVSNGMPCTTDAGLTGVYKIPLDGGPYELLNPNGGAGIAVDAAHVYWTTSTGALAQMDLDGSHYMQLAPTAGPVIAIDPDNVYYSTGDDILSVPKGGGSPTTLATKQTGTYGLVVDNSNVYWANNLGGQVVEVPLSSLGPPTTLTPPGSPAGAYFIAVDETNVYWTNQGNPKVSPTMGTVNMVPKTGGAVTTLASSVNNPAGIAVDDAAVYWTENYAGNVWKLAK